MPIVTTGPLAALDAHRWLYLTEITEPEENVLWLRIEEGRVLDRVVGTHPVLSGRPIVADELGAAYEVVFPAYVAYAVRNESYTVADPYEVFTGRLAVTYTRSRFLDFVGAGTIASPAYPGPFTHYGLLCLNHIVDVAALEPPVVRVLRRGAGGGA